LTRPTSSASLSTSVPSRSTITRSKRRVTGPSYGADRDKATRQGGGRNFDGRSWAASATIARQRRGGGCLFFLLDIIALLLAIVAFRRTSAAGRETARLDALEREVRELRQRLGVGEPVEAPPPETSVTEEPWAAEPQMLPPAAGAAADVIESLAEATPAPAVPPPPAPAAPARIDWERLFGVRAAAVLGGVALALAGLLFFKYSIEHGLIPPWMRVVLGTVVGLGCVAASEWSLRRRYAGTANALGGAGIVVLYAAFWAASALYGLVPMAVGFVLMIAVTGTCTVLAARHASLEIALLGLIGGFATPLLLSSGSDRPFGLFGYIMLLDVALLALAQRRRWPALALLSLAGTVFYQVLWVGTRMGTDRLWLGLAILAVFTVLFVVAGQLVPAENQRTWLITPAAAVVVPFAFALYFAVDADFGPHLNQVAALLVLLSLAAGWLARTQGPPALALGAAAASVAVVGVWVVARNVGEGLDWEAALWACAIALVFHLFVEREPARADRDGPAPPAMLAALGFFAVLLYAAEEGDSLWPWLVGWAGLSALLIRHGGFPGRERLHLAAAVGVALGFAVVHGAQLNAPWFPSLPTFLALLLAASIAFHVVALIPRAAPAQQYAAHAAALLPVALLVSLAPDLDGPALPFLGGTLALGVLAALAATRLASGAWLAAAAAATALVHDHWTSAHAADDAPLGLGTALAMQAFAVVVFTAWPFLAAPRFRAQRVAWAAAALAGPAWFLSLKRLFELRFGADAIGVLPLVLGAVSLSAVVRARHEWPRGEAMRTEGLAWFSAVALGFATVAIPLQLEREWITLGWALEGLAVLVLWTRLDHPGLKYFGVALLGAASVRLVANPAVLGYYPRPAWRIVNWLLYTYLVPAAALLAASRVLHPHEVERLRPWEREYVYRQAQPWGAMGVGLAGLVVVFVWLNLAIADWFATGEALVVSFARLPARDLTTSIAWALYALVLLGIGMARRSIGLRWASLGLLLITIAKVFLHDLGELRDLYRVASLLGLAVSLMLVSLAYQRFVFRSAEET
jgi:hypothetical protein